MGSDDRVRQLSLHLCRGRHLSCLRCVRDPYCGWDREHHECKPYVNGYLQDVSNTTPGLCEGSIRRRQLRAHWGESVHLSCQGHHPELLGPAPSGSPWGAPSEQAPQWFHQQGR